jgi:hypothetical protein
MSFQFQPPFDKKRVYPILAMSLVVLAVLIAGGSVWAFVQYASRPEKKAAATATPTIVNSGPAASLTATSETNGQSADTGSASSTPTTTQSGSTNPLSTATTGSSAPTTSGVTPTVGAARTPTVGVTPTSAPKTQTIGATSPSLLYGTNLNLLNANDQALNGYAAPLLAQMHVGIVRIPMRAGLTQATYTQAAQMVKSINAVPLVILETPEAVSSALSDDAQIIAIMNNIFGSGVYYEYGNEPDLNNSNPTPYITSWNKNVPDLLKLMNSGHLVGPSTYYANYTYLQSFLGGAKPLPEYISWHEYTCDASWDASICISHIENWTTHIAQIRSIMNTAIGKNLPIMITEWNYTPSASVSGDGKHDNADFMSKWTTRALQVLAANNIYAAMQYSCTETQVPLVDASNNLTPQGSVFKQMGA